MKNEDKKYKGVLFDLDGTILFTLSDITASINVPLKNRKIKELNDKDTRKIVGSGLLNALKKAFDKQGYEYTLPELDDAYNELMDYYKNNATKYCKPYDGIVGLLNSLEIPFGILSNKDDSLVKQIANEVFAGINFSSVQGMTTKESRKPDPTNVINFAYRYDIKIEDLLYVGDSEVDYRTAKNAGCQLALVSWGYRDKSDLIKLEEPVLDTVVDLKNFIIGS
ncbi:MAG: HAD family hydrolase [Sphaerochaeta sp.]